MGAVHSLGGRPSGSGATDDGCCAKQAVCKGAPASSAMWRGAAHRGADTRSPGMHLLLRAHPDELEQQYWAAQQQRLLITDAVYCGTHLVLLQCGVPACSAANYGAFATVATAVLVAALAVQMAARNAYGRVRPLVTWGVLLLTMYGAYCYLGAAAAEHTPAEPACSPDGAPASTQSVLQLLVHHTGASAAIMHAATLYIPFPQRLVYQLAHTALFVGLTAERGARTLSQPCFAARVAIMQEEISGLAAPWLGTPLTASSRGWAAGGGGADGVHCPALVMLLVCQIMGCLLLPLTLAYAQEHHHKRAWMVSHLLRSARTALAAATQRQAAAHKAGPCDSSSGYGSSGGKAFGGALQGPDGMAGEELPLPLLVDWGAPEPLLRLFSSLQYVAVLALGVFATRQAVEWAVAVLAAPWHGGVLQARGMC